MSALTLGEAVERLRGMALRKRTLAAAERYGRHARAAGKLYRDEADAIERVLAALAAGERG